MQFVVTDAPEASTKVTGIMVFCRILSEYGASFQTWLSLSVTLNVKSYEPGAVGVPESVDPETSSPGGNVPPTYSNVYGAVPFLTVAERSQLRNAPENADVSVLPPAT